MMHWAVSSKKSFIFKLIHSIILIITPLALAANTIKTNNNQNTLAVNYQYSIGDCDDSIKQLLASNNGLTLLFAGDLTTSQPMTLLKNTATKNSDIADRVKLYTEGLSDENGFMSSDNTVLTINSNSSSKQQSYIMSQIWILADKSNKTNKQTPQSAELQAGFYLGKNKDCGVLTAPLDHPILGTDPVKSIKTTN